jgi:hypothetical protein
MKDALFLLAVGFLGAVICTRPRPVQPLVSPAPATFSIIGFGIVV